MKKLTLLLLLTLTSCNQKIDPKNIQKINGYWEIEKAITADGKKIDYKINETIDYFQIKDNQGFRKKVMPQLDGKYITNNVSEKIKIIVIDNKTYIEYTTPFSIHKEQINEILDNKLILENEQKIVYYYKKHIPFSIK